MTRGGKREGAGRKQLSNRYKEKTQPVRVPQSLLATVKLLLQNKAGQANPGDMSLPLLPNPDPSACERPLFTDAVSAGTPFSAGDHVDHILDLNTHLIHNPPTTFFVRVAGDSMTGAHIFDGDLLIVDRSPNPKKNDIVIAVVDGDLTVKRYIPSSSGVTLQAENPAHADIYVGTEQELSIWGVVMHIIHKAR